MIIEGQQVKEKEFDSVDNLNDLMNDDSLTQEAEAAQTAQIGINKATEVDTQKKPSRLIDKLSDREAKRLLDQDDPTTEAAAIAEATQEIDQSIPSQITVDLGNGETQVVENKPLDKEGLIAVDKHYQKKAPEFALGVIQEYIVNPSSMSDQALRHAIGIIVEHNEVHPDNQIDIPTEGAKHDVQQLIVNTYLEELKAFQTKLAELKEEKDAEDLPKEQLEIVIEGLKDQTGIDTIEKTINPDTGEEMLQVKDAQGNAFALSLGVALLLFSIFKPDTVDAVIEIVEMFQNPNEVRLRRLQTMKELLDAPDQPEKFVRNLKELSDEDLRAILETWYEYTPTEMSELFTDGTVRGKTVMPDSSRLDFLYNANDAQSLIRRKNINVSRDYLKWGIPLEKSFSTNKNLQDLKELS